MKTPAPRTPIRSMGELMTHVQMSPAERARVTAHVEQIESIVDFVASLASRVRARAARK